ncbi:trace amine-associated receptor 1-like [Oculina patagonica]
MNETTNDGSGTAFQEEDAKLIDLPQAWTIFLMFVMILVLTLTVVGNITVLAVLRYSNVLNTIVNSHLLVSLSIADLLVAILVMPCALDAVNTGTWRCGKIWGKINGFGNFLFCISSIIHLMMLSIDRYLAISRPLFYPVEMTSRRAIVICFVAWVYSAVWAFLPLVGVSSYECFISYIGRCNDEDWSKYGLNFFFAISVVSGTYGLALIAMVYVYWKIARVIRNQSRRVANVLAGNDASSSGNNSINSTSRSTVALQNLARKLSRYKGVITLLIVIVVYLICWSPFCFLLFYEIGTGEKVKGPVGSLAMLVGFANSCCNPIIYSIKYKSFRTAVMRLIGKRTVNLDNAYFDRKVERVDFKTH